MKKIKKTKSAVLYFSTFVLFTLTLVMRIYFSGSVAVKNTELKDLSVRKDLLEKEVLKLGYENSSLSSLEIIDKESKRLGFVSIQGGLLTLDLGSATPIADASSR